MRRRRSSSSTGPNMLASGLCHRSGRHSLRASNRQALPASSNSVPWSSKDDPPRVWKWRRPFSIKLGPTRGSERPHTRKKGPDAAAALIVQLQLSLLWMLLQCSALLKSKCWGPGLVYLHVFSTICPSPCQQFAPQNPPISILQRISRWVSSISGSKAPDSPPPKTNQHTISSHFLC